ncbi:putative E3 ubiquitin-protein ligase makorin-4 isoform X2 [Dysidea avara]|uniref:putative E3 ubiquitin-protein ligase makorin-4 isoform X2 n=1 Tax=Dysidea avara TaxID=196820 RepID=UPI00332D38E5
MQVCRYYLKGCCVYGSSCRHDHVKPPIIPSPLSSRGEMPAPLSLASMKRQAKLEQEGEQEPVDDKSNFTVLSSAKLPDNWEDLISPSFKPADNWMDAPEFVPGSSQHTTISKPKEEDIIIPVCVSVCGCIYVCGCTCVYPCACVCVWCTCVCTNACVFACVCVLMSQCSIQFVYVISGLVQSAGKYHILLFQ